MAHKTRVNGTNYGISGGKARVNSTNYKINKGKTRVNGTSYTIAFASAPALISFAVDGITYSAEQNMTWDAWLNSSYNTAGAFYWDAYQAIVFGVKALAYSDQSKVFPSDVIQADYAYMLLG